MKYAALKAECLGGGRGAGFVRERSRGDALLRVSLFGFFAELSPAALFVPREAAASDGSLSRQGGGELSIETSSKAQSFSLISFSFSISTAQPP
jgi:hypothetical protein